MNSVGENLRCDLPTVFQKRLELIVWQVVNQTLAGIQFIEAFDFVGVVILRSDAERLGLHAQVRILGDQYHRSAARLFLKR